MASAVMSRAPHTILLTCAEDGRCHQVTDGLMTGLRARTGRYRRCADTL